MANICLFCNIYVYTVVYILYIYMLLYTVGRVSTNAAG